MAEINKSLKAAMNANKTVVNNNKTKKVNNAVVAEPDIVGPATFDTIFDYFNIKNSTKTRDYLIKAIHDATGMYSLLTWKNDDMRSNVNVNTTNNKAGKLLYPGKQVSPRHTEQEQSDGNNNNSGPSKRARLNANHVNNAAPEDVYIYLGTYTESVPSPYASSKPDTFMCRIFKNKVTNDVIIAFIWGRRLNVATEPYYSVLRNMYRYIMDMLSRIDVNNILLYGFSMGGRQTQHIALMFMEDESNPFKDRLYAMSIGAGGTMSDADIARFHELMDGKFISVGLSRIYDNSWQPGMVNNTIKKFLKIKMKNNIMAKVNTSILPDEDNNTIKTLLLNLKYYMDWKVGRYTRTNVTFKYDNIRTCTNIFGRKNKCVYEYTSDLHDFPLYRKYIHMLATKTYETVEKFRN